MHQCDLLQPTVYYYVYLNTYNVTSVKCTTIITKNPTKHVFRSIYLTEACKLYYTRQTYPFHCQLGDLTKHRERWAIQTRNLTSSNSNPNVDRFRQFFCKSKIQRIFRLIYDGFGFNFVLEKPSSFVADRHQPYRSKQLCTD